MIEKLANLGINLKNKTNGELKTKCPKCSHNRKNKHDESLSVNISTGLYNCHNCGWAGGVMFQKKSEYIIPEKVNAEKRKIMESKFGRVRDINNVVVAAALSKYHQVVNPKDSENVIECPICMIREKIFFPEAGPREFSYFPRKDNKRLIKGMQKLKVGILVSGGIAPGVNAVIDGIVQRHRKYAEEFCYSVNEGKAFNPIIQRGHFSEREI